MNNYSYAGIGSRKTPKDILEAMERVAMALGRSGYILRSGAAEGADAAFETGCDAVGGEKEIFLPWKDFGGSDSALIAPEGRRSANNGLADWETLEGIAQAFHPGYGSLSKPAKKLIARDGYQVLGKDLLSPCRFVACYTPEGNGGGGTGQAIRIAKAYEVPVFDAGKYNDVRDWERDILQYADVFRQ